MLELNTGLGMNLSLGTSQCAHSKRSAKVFDSKLNEGLLYYGVLPCILHEVDHKLPHISRGVLLEGNHLL